MDLGCFQEKIIRERLYISEKFGRIFVFIDFANVNNKEQLYLAAVDVKKEQLIATGSRTVAYVGTASTLTQAEKIAEAIRSASNNPPSQPPSNTPEFYG